MDAGICLCSATNDILFADLENAIRAFGITHLSMTPTVASLVDPSNVPNVEFLVTAGEAMTDVVARKWHEQLYQGYGPSETTNICTVKKMSPNQTIQHLGHSFDNTSSFVLSPDTLSLVPLNCLGELCFGGDQVAQGYLKNHNLTSSKFVDHPEFGRIYRSGDLGRMLPDGSLMIVGRIDDQIKLRGQRIELNEISSTIRQSERVKDAITLLVRTDEVSSDHLIAFFVPATVNSDQFVPLPFTEDVKLLHSDLFNHLSAGVPSYMVPSYLVPISKLPVTASGKLDRRTLIDMSRQLERDYLEAAGMSDGRRIGLRRMV